MGHFTRDVCLSYSSLGTYVNSPSVVCADGHLGCTDLSGGRNRGLYLMHDVPWHGDRDLYHVILGASLSGE
jgi:hypothetical protein